ncbi:MAG: FGGY family carbohydrate kinase [Eggerthia catenaformis]|uniref:FGGY family carbohydrate kinase n=1 Tax=Eggerthia catenaformis TaxID=31973 RepID=UPI003FA08693
MEKYIMALDSGTTSNRCILFNHKGEMCSIAQREFKQIYPQPGWVEHDANEIWATQLSVAVEAMQKINVEANQIAAIGITNQRETTIVWDKKTGEPIYSAIVWQCRRTAKYCDELREKGLTDLFKEKTGLLLDAYFSGTKLKWILDHVENAREKAIKGELLFGTVETWLIWKLTKGKVHVTDYSNASRTLMYNIHTLQWDQELLDILDIPLSMLPHVQASSSDFGMSAASYLGAPIQIAGAAIQWLRDEMRLIDSSEDSEYMAKKVKNTNGCYVVPAFTGLGAPYWDPYARGTIVGITRGVNKYHIIRAALESLAFQVTDVIHAMEVDSHISLSQLKVDGGACKNNLLLSFQADFCNAPVLRPQCVETTAMGAAYLAGLYIGYWKNLDEIKRNWQIDRVFKPRISEAEREERLAGWHKAVERSFRWSEH